MTVQVYHRCRRASDGSESVERWVRKWVVQNHPAICFMVITYCPDCVQYIDSCDLSFPGVAMDQTAGERKTLEPGSAYPRNH